MNLLENMIKKRLFWPVLALLLLLSGLIGSVFLMRGNLFRQKTTRSPVFRVAATIYPLAEFAKQVGGDLVEVATITPPGVEPHDYEPTPQDLATLYGADLVLINGNGVDAWAEKLTTPLRAKRITVIRLSDEINSESLSGDPHFWLDPVLAKQMTERIAASLAVNASQTAQLNRQKEAYVQQLEMLDHAYRGGLASCEKREIITSHNAFRYLAERYGLTSWFILGLSPEEDPSPQTIARVTDEAKRKGVQTIFFETLISPKLAQTIADEVGAKTAVLNPIEGITAEERASGKNYVSLMQENLTQLRLALHCL